MTRRNPFKQAATDAANVIRFPGKLARYWRVITRKAGLRTDIHGLPQALRMLKKQASCGSRPASCSKQARDNRGFTGGRAGTPARGYRIRRLAA